MNENIKKKKSESGISFCVRFASKFDGPFFAFSHSAILCSSNKCKERKMKRMRNIEGGNDGGGDWRGRLEKVV